MLQITSQKTDFTIVNDSKTLKALNAAGLIVWPVMTNNSKRILFKYVDEIDNVGMNFTHNGNTYQLRYNSGCFYPYVYQIFK